MINKFLVNTSIILVALLIPFGVSKAMTLEVANPSSIINVGDTAILNFYINSGEQEINASEGKVVIEGDYEIKSISTAGSVFNVWPDKPKSSGSSGKEITFVGGSNYGVYGPNLKVFSVAIQAKSAGKIIAYQKDSKAFLNDGKGTEVILEGASKEIPIFEKGKGEEQKENQDELSKIIKEDKTPPENFEVYVSKDPSVYGGKYFASFNTTDKDSGIKKYEIIENGNSKAEAENVYILKDQSGNADLVVRAVDNAGNVREVRVIGKDKEINWVIILIAIMIMVLSKKIWAKYIVKK